MNVLFLCMDTPSSTILGLWYYRVSDIDVGDIAFFLMSRQTGCLKVAHGVRCHIDKVFIVCVLIFVNLPICDVHKMRQMDQIGQIAATLIRTIP